MRGFRSSRTGIVPIASFFYGRGGAIASNRQEDQELALLALHLLQIAMVYINTLMIQQVLTDEDVVGADDARGSAGVDPADLCPCDALWYLQTGYAGATALGSGLRPEPVYGGGHEAVRTTLPLVTASFSLGPGAALPSQPTVAPHQSLPACAVVYLSPADMFRDVAQSVCVVCISRFITGFSDA